MLMMALAHICHLLPVATHAAKHHPAALPATPPTPPKS
jgi:hypothetical protein